MLVHTELSQLRVAGCVHTLRNVTITDIYFLQLIHSLNWLSTYLLFRALAKVFLN